MGIESSSPASAVVASISMNLFDFAYWSLRNTDFSYDFDNVSTANNVVLRLSKNLCSRGSKARKNHEKVHSLMLDNLIRGYVYTEKLPNSSFKHHFVLVENRTLYFTADYYNSSKVHIRISQVRSEGKT